MKVSIAIRNVDIKKLLKHIVIIVDTREQQNKHILDYFDKEKIKYEKKALDYGDYSVKIYKNEELGLPFDITLEHTICIERKNGLTEISNNLTHKRAEFEVEFEKARRDGAKIYLLIENSRWADIWSREYETMFNANSFYNSLLSFRDKHSLKVDFIEKDDMGLHIYKILAMYIQKLLKK